MPFLEWDYLQGRWRLLFVLMSGSLSVLPVFIDPAIIPPPYSSLLGVLLFASAATGYWMAGRHRRLGGTVTVAGIWLGVSLVMQWWPFPGATALLLLPVVIATQFLGLQFGLLNVCLAFLYMTLPLNQAPSAEAGERIITLLLIATFWSSEFITQSWAQNLLSAISTSYYKAKAELDAVRDHRLALNQANQDLADAYVQMRRLNNLLHVSRMEAEVARRAKEEFVANVSHELRTPLNMIIGLSEMIVSSPESYDERLPATLLSDVRVIHRNSQHLSQLINDVLDLSQTEAGRLQLHCAWVNPHTIVDESLEVIKPLFQAKGLYLHKRAADELPAIYCDQVRIRQVLLNLLSNAGRFTMKGGTTVQITATSNTVIFSIQDTGPGIPEEEHIRIFEPFHQAQITTNGTWKGSGLGLRICQQFVELHEGRLWLESTVQVGTTFSFSLPCAKHAALASGAVRWVNDFAAHDPYQKQSPEELPQVKRRILLLDSEGMLDRRIEGYLDGSEVVIARNLDEAKSEIERISPDILLVNDIRVMADKDFIRRAIPLPRRMPVLSCFVPGPDDSWKHLNVRDYLVKPMMRQALLSAVSPIVNKNATILVADDDRDTARLTRRQLVSSRCGYRVLTANNACTALEMLHTRPIDLLCLDLNLPDLDGYELLRQKHDDAKIRDIPVVIISARDPTGDPVVAGRLRIERADGLSVRDIVRCVRAMDWALTMGKSTKHPE